MNTYLSPQAITIPHTFNKQTRQLILLLVLSLTYFFTAAQELVFRNPVLEAGTADGRMEFSFDATLNSKSVNLNWVTGMEKELSHFIVERSTNGTDYDQVAMVIADENTSVEKQYTFSDTKASIAKGLIYYRLRMVDMTGHFQNSQVRLIRIGAEAHNGAGIVTCPNPVNSEMRITLPVKWQHQPVNFVLYNANGQLVKQVSASQACQTETINVNELHAGLYIVKAVSGNESAVQRIVKGK